MGVTDKPQEIPNTGILYWENAEKRLLYFDFSKNKHKIKFQTFTDIMHKLVSADYPKRDKDLNAWYAPIESALLVLSELTDLAREFQPEDPKKEESKTEKKTERKEVKKVEKQEPEALEYRGLISDAKFTSGIKKEREWFLFQAEIHFGNSVGRIKAWNTNAKKYKDIILNGRYYALAGEKKYDDKYEYDYLELHHDSLVQEMSQEDYETIAEMRGIEDIPDEVKTKTKVNLSNFDNSSNPEFSDEEINNLIEEDQRLQEEEEAEIKQKIQKRGKKMENNNTNNRALSDPKLNQHYEDINKYAIVGDDYTYSGKSDVPDSAKVQKMTNENKSPIGTENISHGKDNEKAWAVVRATDLLTGAFVESVVIFTWDIARETMIRDIIVQYSEKKKPNPVISWNGKDGLPVLTPEASKDLFFRYTRFRAFAERTANTQAARSAQLKLLNQEWREKDEIAMEMLERRVVGQGVQNLKDDKK